MVDLKNLLEIDRAEAIVPTIGQSGFPGCGCREHVGLCSADLIAPDLSKASLFDDRRDCLDRLIGDMPADGLIMAAGVRRGETVNLIADRLAMRQDERLVHGFDAFDRNWTGIALPTDALSCGGVLPEVRANVRLHRGWIPDTIGPFLAEHPDAPLAFLLVDTDTYLPTRCLLEAQQPRFRPGTIIWFEELIGYPNRMAQEYRALTEVLAPETYSYIAATGQQAAIRIC
jgi:hypothetical protein